MSEKTKKPARRGGVAAAKLLLESSADQRAMCAALCSMLHEVIKIRSRADAQYLFRITPHRDDLWCNVTIRRAPGAGEAFEPCGSLSGITVDVAREFGADLGAVIEMES